MDINQVPIGFGMELAMNEPAMVTYAAMTKAQKQVVLDKARNVRSREEMHSIVAGISVNR